MVNASLPTSVTRTCLAKNWVRFARPESAPTVFVNLSNIGWFGNTLAIDQHLSISRMRALEFERPWCAPPTPAPRPSLTTGAW